MSSFRSKYGTSPSSSGTGRAAAAATERSDVADGGSGSRAQTLSVRSEGGGSRSSPSVPQTGKAQKKEAVDLEAGRVSPEAREPFEQLAPSPSEPLLFTRVAANLFGILLCGAVGLAAFLSRANSQGFFCSDTSIKYPYIEQDTVPIALVIVFAIAAPALIILALEALHHWTYTAALGKRALLSGMYVHLGAFAVAMTGCFAITDVIKQTVGGLRPHFLAVCQPDKLQCTDSNGNPAYIQVGASRLLWCAVEKFEVFVLSEKSVWCSSQDATCTGSQTDVIEEARRSFPSGHSSIAMCGFLFLALYLQGRFKWQRQKSLSGAGVQSFAELAERGALAGGGAAGMDGEGQPFAQNALPSRALVRLWLCIEAMVAPLQVLLVLAALYVGASRIADFKHHLRDVLAGLLVGALTALHGAFFAIDLRKAQGALSL